MLMLLLMLMKGTKFEELNLEISVTFTMSVVSKITNSKSSIATITNNIAN